MSEITPGNRYEEEAPRTGSGGETSGSDSAGATPGSGSGEAAPGGNSGGVSPGGGSEHSEAYSASRHAIQGAGENVQEARTAVSNATASIRNLISGEGNIVDAAVAVKGAFDNVMGLSGRLSATAMMPVMQALSAFKGQAVLPAGKQMDPVLGIDVHMVTIPPAMGVPVPMPHPYIGILFNPKDWVSCAINTFKKAALDTLPPPAEGQKGIVASIAKNKDAIAGIAMGLAGMSASVKFGSFVPRAVTGTKVKSIPHIPMGAGFHPGFAASVAKNNGKAFLGSLFVVADGDPMVGSFHLNYDCWDIGIIDLFKARRAGAVKAPEPGGPMAELFVPSGTVLPIPWGRPVLVNSIPTPINPLAILDKLFKCGLAKLKAAGRRAIQRGLDRLNGRVGCGALTAASRLAGTGQSHPVDVSSGHFYTDNIDFSLPGPIPFSWERIWHSYSSYKGPLGYGWHHSYDMALAIDIEAQAAIMRLSDGRVAHFEIPSIDKNVYNRGEKLTLHLHEEGYYYATDNKSLIYRFTQKEHNNPYNNTKTHLLQSIANRNGFAIRFKYNEKCLLTEITDSAGRKLIVNNDNDGRITSVDAPDPRYQGRTTFPITTYTYSDEGDMAIQADALNQAMHFEYSNHLMIKEIWRNGCNWHFKYNKPSGIDAKCIEVWGTGNLLHYKFDYADPQCTVATNSRGFKKLFYHKNGVVIKFVDALGAEWDKRYNEYNELEWETDPLGNQKVTTYDQWGNVATVTEANEAFIQITYGSKILKHLPIESIDKAGGKWKWDYDENGNLVRKTNPLKAETKYEYVDGFLESITNPKGSKTLLYYDASYNLIKATSINGYEMKWSYNILGNCVKSSDSLGNTRRIQYNLLSLPEIINQPDGNVHYLKFDAEGNMVNAKDKHYDIKFGYDYLNHLLFRIEAGQNVRYKYNNEGNLIELINEHNEVYLFELDAADKVIEEVGFDGLTRNYIRNAAGKIIKVIRPGNKFTEYHYNEVGNIIEVKYHDDTFERYDYAKSGLLITAENPHSVINFERDILGRIIKEACEESFIDYHYDLLGNRIQITSSLGANISNEFDSLGNIISTKANEWQSSMNYNELGFEIEYLIPGNVSCLWIRDKLGRPTGQTIRNIETSMHNRQYSWDVNYRLQKITDSKNGVTQFIHDDIGNLTKTIFSDGTVQLRNPDAVGNLFNSPTRSDRHYGKGGKLLKANGASYKYDDEGNLIEKKETSGKIWQYHWNASGMLQSVTRTDGDVVSFIYDALGRRLSKKYKNTITKWLWDGNKILHEWKQHSRTSEILSNTSVNETGITTWLFNEHSFAPVAKLKGEKHSSIITDYLGTPYQMYNDSGEKIWEANLDSYGKIRMYKGDEGSCPFRYQGQYEDVETGLYYNRFRYYSPGEGNYISPDPIGLDGGWQLYNYVQDPTIWLDIMGLARGDNRLRPDPNAGTAPHSTFARDDNGNVFKYETYDNPTRPDGSVVQDRNGQPVLTPTIRFDGGRPDGTQGAPHVDSSGTPIPTPHMQGRQVPEGARPPTEEETPQNPRFCTGGSP